MLSHDAWIPCQDRTSRDSFAEAAESLGSQESLQNVADCYFHIEIEKENRKLAKYYGCSFQRRNESPQHSASAPPRPWPRFVRVILAQGRPPRRAPTDHCPPSLIRNPCRMGFIGGCLIKRMISYPRADKNCLPFSICACHPCGGAVLTFSAPLRS